MSKKFMACGVASIAIAMAGASKADTFTLNYEAPGVQNSTATFSVKGVETFNTQSTGIQNIVTDFGTNGAITGTYTGVQINSADEFGGAGGTGNYAVAFASTPYTLTLTSNPTLDPQGINYFGYWLSALDAGNEVTFLNNGVVVGQLNPGQVTAAVSGNSAYLGNPNAPFSGDNGAQPYVFINFYDTDGTFNEVQFTETNAKDGGYESDNHTVGYYTAVASAAPEPASWALMLVGVGAAGAGLRGSRRKRAITKQINLEEVAAV